MQCPKCHSVKISKHTTLSSFAVVVFVFVLVFSVHMLPTDLIHISPTVSGYISMGRVFVFAAVIAAAYSLFFGFNKCRQCKSEWKNKIL